VDLADWKEVTAEADIRENEITKASVQQLRLILLKQSGDVFAYHDECPHEQHPLSLGALNNGVLICAKHLWEFEIRTGQNITRIPRAERNLIRYPVRLMNGRIEVDVSSPERCSGE
jgi:toluene monooxygenase system ferredoxin subunit